MQMFEYTEDRFAFHNAFLKYGGVYGISSLEEKKDEILDKILNTVNKYIRFIIGNYNLKYIPKIYVDYIDSNSIGAAVSKVGNTYYIGINVDSVYILLNLFGRLLSCPSVLTQYGNVALEDQDYKLYNPDTQNLYQLYIQEARIIMPRDEKRKVIAVILTHIAILSLVAHELGHIVNGHIDYLKSIGILSWDESDDIPELLSDIEIVQTLESDADFFAWNNMVVYGIESYKQKAFFDTSGIFFNKTLEDIFGIISFAIYSTFRLSGNNIDSDKMLSEKHPHNKLRRAYMGSSIKAKLEAILLNGSITRNQIDSLLGSVMRSIVEVERAFIAVTAEDKSVSTEEIYDSIVTTSSGEYLHLFHKRWASLRPLLMPHALVDLPAVQS